MLSFWERESFINYDYVIIGSGIVGLSTAIAIKEKQANAKVLVLERGIFPTGASTKNAGFACFGSVTELLSDFKTMGEKKSLQLVERRWKGLLRLRARLGENKIGHEATGGYELITDKHTDALKQINHINELIMPIFRKEVYSVQDDAIEKFGFNNEIVKHLIYNKFESLINTGITLRNLLRMASGLGINIVTGAEVLSVTDNEHSVEVSVKNILNMDNIPFRAKKVCICTNAFTKILYPELDITPGRGQVLVTQPIKDLKINGQFHMEEGFYYFRHIGDRILLGGGRQLDLANETTTDFATTEKITSNLIHLLDSVIIPGQAYEIDMKWSGIMAFGNEKVPILKFHSRNVALGVRMGGMGVAIGSLVGEELAAMVTE